eukprot:136502-Rhodomonas_salina.1
MDLEIPQGWDPGLRVRDTTATAVWARRLRHLSNTSDNLQATTRDVTCLSVSTVHRSTSP